MATAKTTMVPNVNLIKQKAAETKKQVTIHQTLSSDAFDSFLRGDMQNQDRIVKDAANELKNKVGVIVLAQASMGHLAEAIQDIVGVPVLKSPPLAMDALVNKLEA
jgi:Asp/Glu/hydantoin racemase